MTRAAIVTRWIGDGLTPQTGFRPAIFNGDFVLGAGETWTDITAQPSANIPPRPNVLIVEVNVLDATLAAIKAHAQYGQAAVLWEGDPSLSPVVTTAQYNALVTFLANKFGVTGIVVRSMLGATTNGRTRYQIAQDIIAYLQSRPRA